MLGLQFLVGLVLLPVVALGLFVAGLLLVHLDWDVQFWQFMLGLTITLGLGGVLSWLHDRAEDRLARKTRALQPPDVAALPPYQRPPAAASQP